MKVPQEKRSELVRSRRYGTAGNICSEILQPDCITPFLVAHFTQHATYFIDRSGREAGDLAVFMRDELVFRIFTIGRPAGHNHVRP